jgi:hypothetical protein
MLAYLLAFFPKLGRVENSPLSNQLRPSHQVCALWGTLWSGSFFAFPQAYAAECAFCCCNFVRTKKVSVVLDSWGVVSLRMLNYFRDFFKGCALGLH